jgi:hypothetical protein
MVKIKPVTDSLKAKASFDRLSRRYLDFANGTVCTLGLAGTHTQAHIYTNQRIPGPMASLETLA